MVEFELKPKEGLSEIKFGMSRIDIRKIMDQNYGFKENFDAEYYFDNHLFFEYEEDDTLSYIEVNLGISPPFKLFIFNIPIHKIGGKRLFELITSNDEIDIKLSEENNLFFKKGVITLARPYKNKKWEAIGIGDKRYYEECIKIDNEYND